MSWISDLLGSGVKDIIDGVTDGVDKFVTTDDERKEIELKMKEAEYKMKSLLLDAELKKAQMDIDDIQGARSMYKADNTIQKILAGLFTIAFFGLSAYMLAMLLGYAGELSQFVTVFISTLFGAFNAIMVQIISFYFGSSAGGEENGRAVAESFNRARVQNNSQ